MQYRSKHLPIYTMLIGLLLLSVATNILFYNRILILQDFLFESNPWVTSDEFNSMKLEINKLHR